MGFDEDSFKKLLILGAAAGCSRQPGAAGTEKVSALIKIPFKNY